MPTDTDRLSMTNTSPLPLAPHTIADVERDTGLGKDTLRVWERRYGFPQPQRDAQGERRYTDDELTRLRHIRRLIDAGHRPGQIVPLPLDRLLALTSGSTQPTAGQMQTSSTEPDPAQEVHPWLDLLRRQDASGLRQALVRMINERGLARTLTEGVAPMNVLVGQSWLEGRLAVHEEHLYTEVVQGTLRHAMVALQPPARPPRVLLTTLPGEQHALGLLMAECFMVLEGCHTVPLGVQTPIPDLVNAVAASHADVVALSFTAAQNPRDVRASLDQLRELLPPEVEIWAGGACPALYKTVRGRSSGLRTFWPLGRLQDIPLAVSRWRSEAGQPA